MKRLRNARKINVTFTDQQQQKTVQGKRLPALKSSFGNIMSLLTKLPENLSKSLIFKRIAAAQSVAFPFKDVSKNTLQIVQAYSNSLGCPDEYIFFPLLTITASFIGTNGIVKINECWEEPSIVWFNVCARKGQKKTAGLNVVAKPVIEIEQELQQQFRASKDNAQDHELPRLMVNHFSFEKLHQVMSNNRNQILGTYDELTQFYNMLDQYKSNSTMDRKTLLALNGGGQWTRDFKNGSCTMENTCFNITGFIQPAYVVKMMALDDFDGFNDRQLFICPKERDVDYQELTPKDPQIPNLKRVYQTIKDLHTSHRTYTFDPEAQAKFEQYHDELKRRKLAIPDDENRRGIIAKAIGQMARVSMILHVLDFAVQAAFEEGTGQEKDPILKEIPKMIAESTVATAITILNHVIETKFALMPPEEKLQDEPTSKASIAPNEENASQPVDYDQMFHADTLMERYDRYVKKILLFKGKVVKASDVSGRHLMPSVTPGDNKTNKYPTVAAESILRSLETLGFGEVQQKGSKSRESLCFRKRKSSEMSDEAKAKLARLEINEKDYDYVCQ